MIRHVCVNSLEFTLGQKAGRKLGKLGSCEIQVLQLTLGQCQWYEQHIHVKKIHHPLLTIPEEGNDLE